MPGKAGHWEVTAGQLWAPPPISASCFLIGKSRIIAAVIHIRLTWGLRDFICMTKSSIKNYAYQLIYKPKQPHRRRKHACQWGRLGGRDSQGAWDGHVNTAILEMDNQHGPTV